MSLANKITALINLITEKKSVAVAYSGGVDSSFLSKVVFDTLGRQSMAITVDSIFIPRMEIEQAKKTAGEIGIRHKIVEMEKLPDEILDNDPERCYRCKKVIFSFLVQTVKSENMAVLFDGSNLDDLADYRPGMKALKELNIESPLLQCQFTKQEIRTASREMGLSTWEHPSQACLASRIPYHTRITGEILKKVEQSEAFLRKQGFGQLRVRAHDDLARIEIAEADRALMFNPEMLDRINTGLKGLGFKYVSLDLEGYKTGKMNSSL